MDGLWDQLWAAGPCVTSHEYSKRVREEGTRTKRTFSPSQRTWVSIKDKQDPGDPGAVGKGRHRVWARHLDVSLIIPGGQQRDGER